MPRDPTSRTVAPCIDPPASDQVAAVLYSELHRIAEQCVADHPEPLSMHASTLVSEACLQLLSERRGSIEKRRDSIEIVARTMRSILVAHARNRARLTAMESYVSALDRVVASYQPRALDLLALDEALRELTEMSPRMARAVELRFFAGLEMDQEAEVLELPKRTLEREWAAARAWLYQRMS